MSTLPEEPATQAGRPSGLRGGSSASARNSEGIAAVDGLLRGQTAELTTVGRRARAFRAAVAKRTTSATTGLGAISAARTSARTAEQHAADVPVRVSPWSTTTFVVVMAGFTAADYFGVNAILRAANLPQRASLTLPLVISFTLLIGAKLWTHWDLSSVTSGPAAQARRTTAGPALSARAGGALGEAPLHVVRGDVATDLVPVEEWRSAAYLEREAQLEALSDAVKARKRAVLRFVGAVMALGITGLVLGLGALGSPLAGGLGLNDGEHDGLLTACAFGIAAGVVLMNVSAAFALAYGMYVPGAAEYRAATRNVQVKHIFVRFLSLTAHAERRSRLLLERLQALSDRAGVRAGLGHAQGVQDVLRTDPDAASALASVTIERLDRQVGGGTASELRAVNERGLRRLGQHLAALGGSDEEDGGLRAGGDAS